MADPKKLATLVVLDAQSIELTIDGEPFPYALADVETTLVEVDDGRGHKELLPAVQFKLLAGTVEVTSARSGGL